jgi:hypothetical protein
MVIDETAARAAVGTTVHTADSRTLGRVSHVLLDDHTGRPAWVVLHGGVLGHRLLIVPLQGAELSRQGLHLPWTRGHLHRAPAAAVVDGRLPAQRAGLLCQHYGLPDTGAGAVVAHRDETWTERLVREGHYRSKGRTVFREP